MTMLKWKFIKIATYFILKICNNKSRVPLVFSNEMLAFLLDVNVPLKGTFIKGGLITHIVLVKRNYR